VRTGLDICFYMDEFYGPLASKLWASLQAYVRRVGRDALSLYADSEGFWQNTQPEDWARFEKEFDSASMYHLHLRDRTDTGLRYEFEYSSRNESPWKQDGDGLTVVRFSLPTEYLSEHGPEPVRSLILELGELLPYCSGHAGLSFHGELGYSGIFKQILPHCFRHPGIDIVGPRDAKYDLGPHRVHGVSWLNFLGQPLLDELGGVEELRARLKEPGTRVDAMGGDRAVVTLGLWPEAGDLQAGQSLPAYRELARLLAPWLYHRKLQIIDFPPEDLRRWEDRFLE